MFRGLGFNRKNFTLTKFESCSIACGMNWDHAIERNQARLLVIVTGLLAELGLAGDEAVERLSKPVYQYALRQLRKAESARQAPDLCRRPQYRAGARGSPSPKDKTEAFRPSRKPRAKQNPGANAGPCSTCSTRSSALAAASGERSAVALSPTSIPSNHSSSRKTLRSQPLRQSSTSSTTAWSMRGI